MEKHSLISLCNVRRIIWGMLLLGLLGCTQPKELEIQLTNTLNQERPDAQVVVMRDSVAKYVPSLAEGSFTIIDSHQEEVPFQLDDLDGDGEWDELALTYPLAANGSSSLFLREQSETESSSFKDRVQVWFAKRDSVSGTYSELDFEIRPEWYQRVMTPPFYYQFEGPGWENDNIGFRLYFDERNGIDIWGKQTSDMVLQNVGLGNDNYHSLAEWGMDILHVGNTLGSGAIGAKVEDELYRLENTSQEIFKEVTDGPVRAIFELTYNDWPIGDKEYTIKEQITIWAGDQGYYNEVSLAGSQNSLNLIAGMVTAKLDGEPTFSDGGSPFKFLMSHGLQSYNGDNLGMSLITTADNFVDYGSREFTGGSVDSTAYIEFDLTQKSPATYKFIAAWETRDPEVADSQTFKEFVLLAGGRMQNPVQLRFNEL